MTPSVPARYLAGLTRYCHFCAGLGWQLGYKALTMLCPGHREALEKTRIPGRRIRGARPGPAPQPARAPGSYLGGGA